MYVTPASIVEEHLQHHPAGCIGLLICPRLSRSVFHVFSERTELKQEIRLRKTVQNTDTGTSSLTCFWEIRPRQASR
jgi:hypothetical protein